jgi:hypothetical protein
MGKVAYLNGCILIGNLHIPSSGSTAPLHDHSFYFILFSKLDLSNFLNIQHLKYTMDLVKSYTVVIVETSTFE